MKNLFSEFKNPIKTCKICFKEIEFAGIFNVLHADSCLCNECQKKLVPKEIHFKVDGVKGTSIYEYDENIKSLLFQLKGCSDIELAEVFLNRYKGLIRFRYHDYVMVPAPSDDESDLERGFNHVIEIFKGTKLPIVRAIRKTQKHKQSDQDYKNRLEVKKYLCFDESIDITNKKVLIVDDVMTTGSTIKAMISLIKEHNPKKIAVVVMSKRVLKED